ncbi:tRNA dimethylallyltransferase [Cribrihabitans marinus]|uniref:tRNA dimethylallyltransferase n=1 Tax=Cribrihabitans marinus TaxID=1227549 RepID=A0A1H6QJC1_9RHOB|nr:tRNA (adenosine(37)-N6)-dimethylallyltransferase MiaA [Cribrihabitans marinus]GGH19103.1 tRNA dimethylallyltransferase [Cribrihabitans marinus]SEI43831.1 tRNA dimethylallyltransferase [Cribrihabitans marinus]
MTLLDQVPPIPDNMPVLIAGPTASGKSELALQIAERHGGVIVNADASQVYACWRVVTARPSPEEEARAPHRLYGHVAHDAPYSAGHWLREVLPLLDGPERPIITGGTGLYFKALTEGMAEIPATPPAIRAEADALPLEVLLDDLDRATAEGLDRNNRARVQRAWEVQRATGRPLADWQADTPPPTLDIARTVPILFDVEKDWLNTRIEARFSRMIELGALDEVAAMRDRYDPTLPSCKAIGAPELVAFFDGEIDLDTARRRATIATRRFAKRQRTWFRARMTGWHHVRPGI